MSMTPRARKCALTAHVTLSIGWVGAVLAYLVLAVAGLTSRDAQLVRAAYLAMELIGWWVIVPCCIGSLLSGLVESAGTEWGLIRHYWVLAKLVLTVFATVVLLLHMPTVSRMAALAADAALPLVEPGVLRVQLVIHAGGGLVVLLAATVLSIFKPWGRTWWAR